MNFAQLHERLRVEILRRIERGTLSGTLLSRQTGYRQSHISNFLRQKRMLSLGAVDRVLDATAISVRDLIPAERQASFDFQESAFEDQSAWISIPLVSQSTAIHDHQVAPRSILDQLKVPAAMLEDVRPNCSPSRRAWFRFVAVRATPHEAEPMRPVIQPHALLVIDRHYCSLAPYHASEPTLFAVRYGNILHFRYVAFEANRLVLRPYNFTHPIDLLDLEPDESAADALTGRICLSLAPF